MEDEDEDEDYKKQRAVYVVELETDSEDSTAPNSSDEDNEAWLDAKISDAPSDFWHIQKLIKYMKTGNQTAVLVALSCLQDHDLTSDANQMAVQDCGGLEVLVNILETKDLKSKLCCLSVISVLAENFEIRTNVVNLGLPAVLVALLTDPAKDLQVLAAECLGMICKVRKARKVVRKNLGIPKIVDMMDVKQESLVRPLAELSVDDMEAVNLAKAGAMAMCSLSESKANIAVMGKTGVIPILGRLIHSVHPAVVTPAMATLANCAQDPTYCLGIRTEGMVPDIVRGLSGDEELKKHCAVTIFKCAMDEEIRVMLRQAGGLDPLVELTRDRKLAANKALMAGATGAIWKCALNEKNVLRLDQLGAIGGLVGLLNDDSEDVLTNAVGALSQVLKSPKNRSVLRNSGGIPPLISLLNRTHAPLLQNVPLVLCESAKEYESMAIIDKLDGVRLIWSLLKNKNPRVQENAAWALCPCVENANESGEMVRSFVGGLQLTVSLLSSKDPGVLAAVCAAIAVIAKDRENLAVISDHGVIEMLSNLVDTENDILRENLSAAIANCCSWGSNCKEFGRRGAITPLVGFMAADNPKVHRTTAAALYSLSTNAFNCITMHESGVVVFLLKAVSSKDEVLQEAAAGCLRNIRRLALEAETFHLFNDETDILSEDEDD